MQPMGAELLIPIGDELMAILNAGSGTDPASDFPDHRIWKTVSANRLQRSISLMVS
jgi:hypothetical protein